MKKRIASFLLAIVMAVTLLPVQAWGASASEIIAQIESTYEKCKELSGMSQFSGYCGTYVGNQLVALGINTYYIGGNGKDQFDLYKNSQTTTGGYSIRAYPASLYSLNDALSTIMNGRTEAYNILVGFEKGSGEDGAAYGHTVFIHAILGNIVYFSESSGTSLGGSYYPEGSAISCSIDSFCNHYSSWTVLDGVILFYKNLTPSDDYLSNCTEIPTYLKIKVTSATTIKSLPCSKATSAKSVDIRNGVIGEVFTTTAMYKNTAGNYWYKVSVNGQTGYVYAGNTAVSAYLTDDVTISGVSAPTQITQGSTFSIKGEIRSTYRNIKTVNGYITGAKEYSGSATVNGRYYSLYNSAVDYALYFNYLPTGNYNYKITATGENYYSSDGSSMNTKAFTVTLVNQAFTVGTPSHTHSWTLKTDNDEHWYACSCGATTDTASHTYSSWTVSKEATCTASGLRSRTCSVCNHVMTETIPATGHSFSQKSDYAYHWEECFCGEITNKKAHTYGDWIIIKEATCTTGGSGYRVCTECGHEEGFNSSAVGHTYDDGIEKDSYIVYTCTKCGDSYTEFAFTYSTLADGTLSITGYKGTKTYVTVPSEIDGRQVTAISTGAFQENNLITHISIPDSVTYIGDYAFAGCENLVSVILPNNITSLENSTFSGCQNLADIIIPDSVTTIGGWVFWGCHSLSNITIPDNVTSIGRFTFSGCFNLASIIIPASVASIEDSVFFTCDSLDSVYYKGSQEQWNAISIGSNNEALTSAKIYFNCPTAYEWQLLSDGTIEITKYTGKSQTPIIPDMIIGKPVTRIGNQSFSETAIITVTIPDSVTSIGDSAFAVCRNLTSIVIPNNVTSIGPWAFHYCTNLSAITIPNSVTEIGHWAFQNCVSLTSISLPQNITSIDFGLFQMCENLSRITIPENVTSIDNQAFYGCRKLTSVTLSNNITSIGAWAFKDCSSLTDVYYNGSQEQWNSIIIWAENDTLTGATFHFTSIKGDLNGSGDAPDVNDVQCLYTYLTNGEMLGAYKDSPDTFTAVADVNNDGHVDVYDLQRLYEVVSGIAMF